MKYDELINNSSSDLLDDESLVDSDIKNKIHICNICWEVPTYHCYCTPCFHSFCKACIHGWIIHEFISYTKVTCPVCRKRLKFKISFSNLTDKLEDAQFKCNLKVSDQNRKEMIIVENFQKSLEIKSGANLSKILQSYDVDCESEVGKYWFTPKFLIE